MEVVPAEGIDPEHQVPIHYMYDDFLTGFREEDDMARDRSGFSFTHSAGTGLFSLDTPNAVSAEFTVKSHPGFYTVTDVSISAEDPDLNTTFQVTSALVSQVSAANAADMTTVLVGNVDEASLSIEDTSGNKVELLGIENGGEIVLGGGGTQVSAGALDAATLFDTVRFSAQGDPDGSTLKIAQAGVIYESSLPKDETILGSILETAGGPKITVDTTGDGVVGPDDQTFNAGEPIVIDDEVKPKPTNTPVSPTATPNPPGKPQTLYLPFIQR